MTRSEAGWFYSGHDIEANMKLVVALAVLGVLAVAPGRLAAQETGDPQKGRVLARAVCLACHAVEKGRSSPDPTAPTFEHIASVPGMSTMALAVALRTPHRTMPNLVLEGDELVNIIAYILSLKRD
jgi:mono/diheme cytochrome c family protein